MSAKEFFNKKSTESKEAKKARERQEEINRINLHGTNLFFAAVESNKLQDVERMILEGADIHARTTARGFISNLTVNVPYAIGATPLHAACLLGSPAITQALIEEGARANAKDNAGHTPLDYAILSYNYFKDDLARKETSRFSFQRSVNKAEARVAEFDDVISKLLAAGGKPAMFTLPQHYAAQDPRPSAPPLP